MSQLILKHPDFQPENVKFDTVEVHAGEPRDTYGSLIPPIYQTSTFYFASTDDAVEACGDYAESFAYSRITNPSLDYMEQKLAALEHGKGAVSYASGMGAVAGALFAALKCGDHVIFTNQPKALIGDYYISCNPPRDFMGTTIAFAGWSAVAENDYEIVYIPDSVSMTTIQRSEKYIRPVAAGQTKVIVPGGYVQGVGALAVRKDGISQAPGAYTETSPAFITIPAPIIDCIYELTVTRPDANLTVAALYVQQPSTMTNDSDAPQISNEDHQRGIVHYAAHLALSKEGKMTQDLQKSQIHLARFEEVIEAIASLTKPQVDISPYVQMPFKV